MYLSVKSLTLFRNFYNWASEQYGIISKNPFKKIIVSKPKPAPREFWTIEECEKIIANAPTPEYKCSFAIMAFAGLRREEARLLKRENLEGSKLSLIGKGSKAATLPISSRLKKYLNEYLTLRGDDPGYLFPALTQQVAASDYALKVAVVRAELESTGTAHYHRFRHSFASNLLRAGKSIKAVQMLMRHEDVSLTLNIYGHLLPSDLQEACEL
ncbi:recombinase XerC [Fibrobacteria bacterium R8-3-H12]